MRIQPILLAGSLLLVSLSAWSAGRSPASLPKPTSQGEQMLNSVWDPNPSFAQPVNKSKRVAVIGVCRTAYGARFNSVDRGYNGCIDAGPSGDVSSALRRTGGGVLFSP